jgi:hypothetical protein
VIPNACRGHKTKKICLEPLAARTAFCEVSSTARFTVAGTEYVMPTSAFQRPLAAELAEHQLAAELAEHQLTSKQGPNLRIV